MRQNNRMTATLCHGSRDHRFEQAPRSIKALLRLAA